MLAMFFVWFAGVAASLKSFLIWGAALPTVVILAGKGWNALDGKSFPVKGWVTTLVIAAAGLAAAMPSERTVYMMGGAYLGQKALESETSSKVVQILNNKLDEILLEAGESVQNATKGK